MITKIIITVIALVVVVGLSLFIYGIKTAPTIDDKEPFLWDDYNPKD